MNMSPPPGRFLLHLPPSPTPTPVTQKPETRTTPSLVVGPYGVEKNGEALPRRRRPLIGHTPEGRHWAPPLTFLLTTICFIHPTRLSSLLLTARLPLPPLRLNTSSKFPLRSAPTQQATSPKAASQSTPCAKPATTAGATFVLWDATWTNTTPTNRKCAPPWWSATRRCPACTHETLIPTQLKDKFNSTLNHHKRRNRIGIPICHGAAFRTSLCPRPS